LLLVGGISLASTYTPEQKRILLAIGFAKAFEAISDVFHGDLQRRERMNCVAVYLIAKGVLSVGAVSAGVRYLGGVSGAAVSLAAVFAAVLFLAEARFAVASAQPRFHWPALRRLSVTALPLGIVMMLISVNTNMPRYFVERWHGPHALGIFAALTYLTLAGSNVVNAVGLAITPQLARLYAAGQRSEFYSMLLRMGAVAGLMGLAGVAALATLGRPLLTLVYGRVYASHVNAAIWVMAAGSVSYVASVFGYGMTAARLFRPQLPLFAVVTLLAAGASLWFVPRYELPGAAGAQLVAAVAQLAGSAAILWWAGRRESATIAVPAEVAA
jgi:O-antigen/teichoic acid export membrane protein